MLDTITVEDMAGQVRELLTIKYADPRTRSARDKLLRKRVTMVVEIRFEPHAPLVLELRPDSFTVETGHRSHADLSVAIPMRDLMGLFRMKLPLRSLLRRRIHFRGSVRDALLMGRLFRVEVRDPAAAFAFFRHYFLETK